MLGSHVTTIAYPLLVLHLTGSPFTAGCAVFAATAPSMFAYIPAGALVDRWSKVEPKASHAAERTRPWGGYRRIAVTMAFGRPMVPLLMTVAVIEGVLEVFSGLAERRYVGSVVEQDQVSSALVRLEARTHVVLVAGRPLGGLLFDFGPIFPFLADMASFIYSVAILLGIKDTSRQRSNGAVQSQSAPKESLIADIRQGILWIRQDKFARMAIVSFSLGTLIFQALIMVFLGEAHSRAVVRPRYRDGARGIGHRRRPRVVGGSATAPTGPETPGCGFKLRYGSPDSRFSFFPSDSSLSSQQLSWPSSVLRGRWEI